MALTFTTRVPYFPPANTTWEHKNQNTTTCKYNFAINTKPAHKNTHARTGRWVTYDITRTNRPLPQLTRVNSAIKDTTIHNWAPSPLSKRGREFRTTETYSRIFKAKKKVTKVSILITLPFLILTILCTPTRYKIIIPCLSRLYTRKYLLNSPNSHSKIPPTNNNTRSQNEGLGLRWTVISMGYTSRS